MTEAQIKALLLAKPEAVEDYPFGPDAAVFKLQGKMFALLFRQHGQLKLNLKCDPEEAQMLRDVFTSVAPGYHMNKRHWNTVTLDGSLPSGEIQRMLDNSYALILRSLPRAVRLGLEARHGRDALYPA
jgi:predicted DNA-binding protein (MmcQ/YjbR family)